MSWSDLIADEQQGGGRALATTERAAAHHEIFLIDHGCCSAQDTEAYAKLLRERFTGRASVFHHLLDSPLDDVVPGLQAQGAERLPIVVLDGELLWQGDLPNWLQMTTALEQRMNGGQENR
jgi:hypothetical protein